MCLFNIIGINGVERKCKLSGCCWCLKYVFRLKFECECFIKVIIIGYLLYFGFVILSFFGVIVRELMMLLWY